MPTLQLLRRHHRQRSPLQRVREIVRNDHARAKMISDRIRLAEERVRGRRQCPPDVVVRDADILRRLSPAPGSTSCGFKVGTPAQTFLLVADTGQRPHLDEVPLQSLPGLRGRAMAAGLPRGPVIVFQPHPCSSQLCKNSLPFSLAKCLAPTSPCEYDYGSTFVVFDHDDHRASPNPAGTPMVDGAGIFADEVATVALSGGQSAKLKGIVVGCTSSSAGSSFRSLDGVLGLGYSNTSFAARAASRFAASSRTVSSTTSAQERLRLPRLRQGHHSQASKPDRRRYAELILNSWLEPFYAVRVGGVSVGAELLNISEAVWDSGAGGGVILDSGTSLAMLAEPAYRAVLAALSAPLARYPKVEAKPFEFCFKWDQSFDEAAVPRLVVHLVGPRGAAAPLRPPVKSYLIDVADGVKCIGILSASWPGVSTIGNILQQNHLWEFDIANRRVSFEPSSCSRSLH
ncbi:unnamed protein product [Spirodela intermedia]|uniref:Peptidase A1 domain-containing protein n=1 Tax=Spirodela intermedia TaxID=51605 RepID=A0A7I8J6R8_SPIIN|nr:unnamed protein product [Spirodela intermedia]CAA6665734.1 unnamed protein product [Spirodela intermedia]